MGLLLVAVALGALSGCAADSSSDASEASQDITSKSIAGSWSTEGDNGSYFRSPLVLKADRTFTTPGVVVPDPDHPFQIAATGATSGTYTLSGKRITFHYNGKEQKLDVRTGTTSPATDPATGGEGSGNLHTTHRYLDLDAVGTGGWGKSQNFSPTR